MKLLLEAHAEVNYMAGERSTPLIGAVISGADSSTIQLLLDAGAEVDRRDEKGRSPLNYAISMGQLETVKLLLTANA
jgi:ankyrin repeat protein